MSNFIWFSQREYEKGRNIPESKDFILLSAKKIEIILESIFKDLLVDISKSDSFAKHQLYKSLCVGILRSSWNGSKVRKLVLHRFSVVLNIYKDT